MNSCGDEMLNMNREQIPKIVLYFIVACPCFVFKRQSFKLNFHEIKLKVVLLI